MQSTRRCAAIDCDRTKLAARGLCSKHYQRFSKTGDIGGFARVRPAVKGQCSIRGCGKPHDSHGLCGMHAARERNLGSATAEPPNKADRFWKNAEIGSADECWLWHGRISESGYGRYGKRGIGAHRIAVELSGRDIPAGMHVDHLCRVKSCVNPNHLDVVTPRENALRMHAALGIRSARTHCPQGHPYDFENTYISPSRRRQCRACGRDRRQKIAQAAE